MYVGKMTLCVAGVGLELIPAAAPAVGLSNVLESLTPCGRQTSFKRLIKANPVFVPKLTCLSTASTSTVRASSTGSPPKYALEDLYIGTRDAYCWLPNRLTT